MTSFDLLCWEVEKEGNMGPEHEVREGTPAVGAGGSAQEAPQL